MNFPVIEMFHSIQGEGAFMGVPTFFVRVSGCNLRCVFKDSCCDTPYSSFNPETSPYKDVDDVVDAFVKMYNKNPKTSHLCITGGEPMLYQKGIDEFLTKIWQKIGWFNVTIETNGTIDPTWLVRRIWDKGATDYDISLFSISPKLSTSVDRVGKLTDSERERHNRIRINPKILAKYVDFWHWGSAQLKFVYSGEECIAEIKDLLKDIKEEATTSLEEINDLVYLMPEGTTVDQMNAKHKECVEKCLENGWKFAPRLHIMIWGDLRGV